MDDLLRDVLLPHKFRKIGIACAVIVAVVFIIANAACEVSMIVNYVLAGIFLIALYLAIWAKDKIENAQTAKMRVKYLGFALLTTILFVMLQNISGIIENTCSKTMSGYHAMLFFIIVYAAGCFFGKERHNKT